MTTVVLIAFATIIAIGLAAASIREALRDERRPVRHDPGYDTRRPGLER